MVYKSDKRCGVGAVPPWLLLDPEDVSPGNSQDIGPSLQDFLKHSKQVFFRRCMSVRGGEMEPRKIYCCTSLSLHAHCVLQKSSRS